MGYERILAGEMCSLLWDKSTVFLWLNMVFIKFFVILVRYLFKCGVCEGGVYFKKQKHVLELV